MTYAIFDTVVTTIALPQHGIVAGQTGVIVDRYDATTDDYEVEFCNAQGETVALLPLNSKQIVPQGALRKVA